MLQKPYTNSTKAPITTTTSFIISSNESLNKRPFSSSQSSSSSSNSSNGDNMAAAAAANDSIIQNNHHHHNHSYFVPSTNPIHGSLAFNQSSESSVSSSSYSSSSLVNANCHQVVNHQPTPTSMNVTSSSSPSTSSSSSSSTTSQNRISDNLSGFQQQQQQQQQSIQRFGSTPNQLSVNSLNEQQYMPNFMDTRQQQVITNLQFVDDPNSTSDFSQPNSNNNRLLSNVVDRRGYYPNHTSTYTQQNANNSGNNSSSELCQTTSISVKSSFQQQQQQQHSPNNQSLNSLDSTTTLSNTTSQMPINVKGMILNGVSSDEVLKSWLISIKCDEYLRNFLDHGYDAHLLTTMTPQDLTAIGCKSPNLRKKLLYEIKKLNLDDDIPNYRPNDLAQWLSQLKLSNYYGQLCREGYDSIEKVCQLTWEDLEDIGIVKLGHQKRLLLGIERLKKQQDDANNSKDNNAIYDVHPNHRVSLHPGMLSSEKRSSRSTVRSGFFTTKSGNLDNRGVPVATVMPALKHINNSLAHLDLSQQQTITTITGNNTNTNNISINNNNLTAGGECLNVNNQKIYSIENGIQGKSPQTISQNNNNDNDNNNSPSSHQQEQQQTLKMSDFSSIGTMKRPPPLPPVRTNSLKVGASSPGDYQQQQQQQQQQPSDSSNNIYDNTYGAYHQHQHQHQHLYQQQANNNQTINNGMGYNTIANNSSTSFLRTPKLGTLTATTNKMLSHGGHIQTISTQPNLMMKPVPIREAPHPPAPQSSIHQALLQQAPLQTPPPPPPPPPTSSLSFSSGLTNSRIVNEEGGGHNSKLSIDPLMDSSMISHQIAGADEFPPPPPPPQ